MNSQNPIVSFTNNAWRWLSRWWRPSDNAWLEDHPPRLIKVWDTARGNYRMVDLRNTQDPLWTAACELQRLHEDSESDRTAA